MQLMACKKKLGHEVVLLTNKGKIHYSDGEININDDMFYEKNELNLMKDQEINP